MSIVMQRLSYPTETVLSNKIARNRIVLHLKTVPKNHYDGDLEKDQILSESGRVGGWDDDHVWWMGDVLLLLLDFPKKSLACLSSFGLLWIITFPVDPSGSFSENMVKPGSVDPTSGLH